ncbi:MAG: DUF721 domain-containing protein [Muribaculaceae bacterium]|nr:DUF721 domain-containing protein [Muribaculaceae bacterium]MDE5929295.1 DUF721 domain-containing protein [Muribaculaceae bacterium]MDE6130726.1 DUF721 domain-containing protein [Muribaculaceae bacterium]
MKKTEPKRVDMIIREAIEATGKARVFDEQRLCYLWADVVGPWINAMTTRRYVEGGRLHVYIASASLKSELQFSLQQLTDALNRAVGDRIIEGIELH